MLRASCYGIFVVVAIAGCRMVEREALSPLAENAPPLSYAEMLGRARSQAGLALDAYYVDAWLDLEQAAQRLEQTARHLPNSRHVPDPVKTSLAAVSESLRQDAVKLAEAARAKNSAEANAAMQRIHLQIRQLRPEEPLLLPPPPASKND